MSLDEAALNVGRQLVKHAVAAWLDVRREQAQRGRDLVDLLSVSVVDRFHRRDLTRQFEKIGDEAARRLQPLYAVEFGELPENERAATLDAVLMALQEADLSDRSLFEADVDPIKLAMRVRGHVPDMTRRAGLSADASVLYKAVLDQCCIALVSIVSRLPEFQARVSSELLGRTASLAEDISLILERLPRTSLDAPEGRQNDNEFRRRYLELVSTELDRLDLFGIDTHHYRPRTRVSVAYFSLTVTGRIRESRSRRVHDDEWFSGRRHDGTGGMRVEDALAIAPRTLLRGDAGSGKSTLLQWVAVNCARGGFSGSLAAWNGRVPFFVRLRSYGDRPPPRPEELPESVADQIIGLMPDGWVHRQLADNAILLVDGVDELAPAQRGRVREWLGRVAGSYQNLPIIVTSRPAAASGSWLDEHGFVDQLLEPMSPGDIAEFCRRWHEAIRSATEHDPTALPCTVDELGEYEAALLRNLDARRSLRALATNPLLCAMLCALNLDRHKQLPPDRMALYSASLDMLLERRDADRGVPASQEVRVDRSAKMAILQHLAWRFTEAGRVELPFSDCTHHVERAIKRLADVNVAPEVMLRYLLERSGVIRDPAVGRVDFVHRTFQEYLAAKEAADEHLIDLLIHQATSDRWRETIVMATGHATTYNRNRILTGILDRADNEPNSSRRLRLLASACMETSSKVDDDIVARIDTALMTLVPPRAKRESRTLSLAGDRLLRRLPTSLDGLSPASGAACVRTAALVNGPAAMQLLSGYASDPRHVIQREIADVWRYFDAEEYAKTVLRDAPLQDGRISVERIEHIPLTKELANLTSLNIYINRGISDLRWIHDAPHLKRLNVITENPLSDLSPLSEHPELHTVWIQGVGTAGGLEILCDLPRLDDILLTLTDNVRSIEFIESLPSLRYLRLRGMSAVQDLAPLNSNKQLRMMELEECSTDPTALLHDLKELTSLTLSKVELPGGLPSIEFVFPQLTHFGYDYYTVNDPTPLEKLKKVESLHMWGTKIEDLRPVSKLPNLRSIYLYNCPPPLDLSPLIDLPRRIDIFVLRKQEVSGLQTVRARHRVRRL